jgi:hypothetical protein
MFRDGDIDLLEGHLVIPPQVQLAPLATDLLAVLLVELAARVTDMPDAEEAQTAKDDVKSAKDHVHFGHLAHY